MSLGTYHRCVEGWRPPPLAATARDAAMFGLRQLSDERKAALVWTGLTVFPAASGEARKAPSEPVSRSNPHHNRSSPTVHTSETVERIVVGPWVPYRDYGIKKAGYEHSRYVTYLPNTPSKPPAPSRNIRAISSIPLMPARSATMPKVLKKMSGLFKHSEDGIAQEGRKKKGNGKEKGKEMLREELTR